MDPYRHMTSGRVRLRCSFTGGNPSRFKITDRRSFWLSHFKFWCWLLEDYHTFFLFSARSFVSKGCVVKSFNFHTKKVFNLFWRSFISVVSTLLVVKSVLFGLADHRVVPLYLSQPVDYIRSSYFTWGHLDLNIQAALTACSHRKPVKVERYN